MKNTLYPLLTALLGICITSALTANITLEELFDYPAATVLSDTQTGGSGFSGGYYADDALTTSPSTTSINTTGFAAGLGTLNVDVPINDIGTLGGGIAHRALGSGAFNNNPAAATTLYLSFTYRSDGVTGGARFGFGRDANRTLEFRQAGAAGPIRALWSQSGGGALGSSVETASGFGDEFLFVVVRLDFGNAGGDDRIRYNVYQANGTVVNDDTWEVDSGLFTMQAGDLNQIYFDSGGSNTRFGNIRLGGSFYDVTGIAGLNEILIEENFNYAPGTTLSAGEMGGTGFSGGYYMDAALTTSPSSTVVNTTAYNLGILNVGLPLNNMGTIGGGDSNRALGTGAFDNNPATATTLYLSFTYKSDGTTGGGRFGFGRGADRSIEFRQIGSFNMRAYAAVAGGGLDTVATTTDTYGNEALFVVARIDLGNGAGGDRIRFNVYQLDGTIVNNDTWQVDSGAITMQSGVVDQIYFDSGGSNNRFGNIRAGTSFMAVTGVAASAASAPIPTASLVGGNVVVSFATESPYTYQLEKSTDLSGWSDIGGQSVAGDGTVKALQDAAPTSGEVAFYRIRVE